MSLPAGPDGVPVPRVCLVVLDGWGLAPDGPGNAVSLAATPVFDELWTSCPHTELSAGGESVGLPEGQMGNSEVGHLNLGAGAVVRQDLTRIDAAAADGALGENEVLRDILTAGPRVHLIGLISHGGVHSGFRHLRALVTLAAELEVEDLVIHAFTDGRDTAPDAAGEQLRHVEEGLERGGVGRIGSVVGRYFAMDRDSRWDRIQRAYDLLVHGEGEHEASTAVEAIEAAYARAETDEFITPTRVGEEARIRPGDAVLGVNFRPDRMREISRALAEPDFAEVDRGGAPPVEPYATLTEYQADWPYPVAFPPERPEVTLAGVLADAGAAQLHVAETEKYAHVTYFFNGGEEEPHEGEERELVPSPRDVATYDEKPEMSADGVADALVEGWGAKGEPRFAIVNFANPDMVGHTGVIPAAVEAIETVDAALRRVLAAVHESGGACVVTADHGNADHMLEDDDSPSTAHSLNPVPLVVTVSGLGLRDGGVLADVAPTVLELLGLEQPPAMTGRSLLAR